MKKILFIIALFCGFVANSQKTTGSNYTYINQRYEWLAGVFKALGLPAGSGPAAFTAGQEMRAGAVYYDSLGADAGFYIYNGSAWVLQGTSSAVDLPNALLAGGQVVYSGTGLKFYITPSVSRINGIIYGTDQDSVTLSSSDPDDPRKDVIYLATTGVEVLTGTPAGPAAEPQLDADEIKLTVVDVPALATTPGFTQQVLYDENTESTVAGNGVVVNPASTAEVYRLTVAIDVGTLSNADVITLDAALPTLAWDLTGVNSLDGFIKLKAVMPPEGRLRLQLFNGSTSIGSEVNLVINKSFLGWQPFSIPVSAMGNLTSLSFTKVRIRYNTTVGNYAGFTLDYTYLQDGIVQPGPGGGVSSVTLQGPTGWTFTGPTTGNVIQTIIPGGTSTQILGGDGVVKTDSSVKYIGTINSLTKSANGATINTITNEIVLQESDEDNNGLTSAYRHRQMDTLLAQTIENSFVHNDSLVYIIDEFRTGVKVPIAGSGVTITPTDTTLVFSAIGGGGNNIYNIDSTLANDRTITLAGNYLKALQGTAEFLLVDPTPGAEAVVLQAFNTTGSGNTGSYSGATTSTNGIAQLSSSFNAGNAGLIKILSDNTGAYGTYNATLHEFNGNLNLTGDSIRFIHDNFVDITDSGDYYMTVTNKATGATGKAPWPDVSPPNIIVQTAGGGEPIWYTSGDTLYLKSINGATTDTDSSLNTSGGGVTTMAAIGSSANANGATISGSTLTLQPASGSFGGVLTTGTQSIGGLKVFNNGVQANGTTGITASGSTVGVQGTNTSSSTSTVVDAVWATRSAIYVGAAGNGIAVLFGSRNSAQSQVDARLQSFLSDATAGSENHQYNFTGLKDGATVTMMNIQDDGTVRVNNNLDSLSTKAYARSVGGGGGSSTFIGLTDVPASFSGQALKVLRANAGETALEFVTLAGGGDALTTDPLSQFAATTSAQLSGVISNETGTGLLVYNTSPTFSGTITTSLTASRALVTGASNELAVSATTATELGYVNGVTSSIQTQLNSKTWTNNVFSTSSATFADGASLHFGSTPATPHATATVYEITMDQNCTLIGALVEGQFGTAGTDEGWDMYIRVNNTTDYLISTVSVSAGRRTWANTAMNTTGITLTTGDKIVVKSVAPTWATNPATGTFAGYLRFKN